MRNFRFVVGRNLNLFLENKLNILLSWMSVLIVLTLYFVFLRNFTLQMVENRGIGSGLAGLISDRFMVAGLLIVITTTTCFGPMQARVKDKEKGMIKDYLIAPISKVTLNMGYVTSCGLVASSYSILTYICMEFYFYYQYGSELTTNEALLVMGTLILASFINSFVLFLISEIISNTTDFSTFANLYGTIIGFLAGAYLPYFFYAKWLKKTLFYLPCTQLTCVLRKLFTQDILIVRRVGLKQNQIETFKETFGISLKNGKEFICDQAQYRLLVLELALLFLVTLLITMKKSAKRNGF